MWRGEVEALSSAPKAGRMMDVAATPVVAWETVRCACWVVGLLALIVVSGCAALKRTEDLPVPTDSQSLPGGPEGENDNADGL